MQKLIVYLTGEGKSDIGYRNYATGGLYIEFQCLI